MVAGRVGTNGEGVRVKASPRQRKALEGACTRLEGLVGSLGRLYLKCSEALKEGRQLQEAGQEGTAQALEWADHVGGILKKLEGMNDAT